MIILGIESSCDETGVAIIEVKKTKTFNILANVLDSQIDIHKKTNGVVPEVAARRHVETINPIINKAFKDSKIGIDDIDVVGVTYGPGLIGSLLIGIEAAKTIAYVANKPLIGINHLKAHIQANYFDLDLCKIVDLDYPALALLVSGGHTELVLIQSQKDYALIGQTLDDAVGESFDKVAKLLGLSYPGGPEVARLAEKGDDQAFDLPVPMKNSMDYNFSYSGLKTAVRDTVMKIVKITENDQKNISASFQRVAIEQLILKTLKALEKYNAKTLLIAGGVSANKYLRKQLRDRVSDDIKLKIPEFDLCTDNALMVAMSTYLEYEHNPKSTNTLGWKTITAEPGLNF